MTSPDAPWPATPESFRFCPRCATPLETRLFEGKPRRTCLACGYIRFSEPKVGVGVMVVQEGKILLVQRAMNPERGKWTVPAGYLDYGEDPRQIAAREAEEETHLQVAVTELIDVYYNPESLTHGGASIFIMYRATVIGGTLQADDDAAAAAFFPLDHLPELAFASTHDAIHRLRHSLSR